VNECGNFCSPKGCTRECAWVSPSRGSSKEKICNEKSVEKHEKVFCADHAREIDRRDDEAETTMSSPPSLAPDRDQSAIPNPPGGFPPSSLIRTGNFASRPGSAWFGAGLGNRGSLSQRLLVVVVAEESDRRREVSSERVLCWDSSRTRPGPAACETKGAMSVSLLRESGESLRRVCRLGGGGGNGPVGAG
jgi:hypothetical protein